MAAGLAFFGAEGGAEAVDFTEGHGVRFVVELAGLSEVGFIVVEVIDFEERGGAFASGGGEDGRVDEGEAVGIEIIADGLDDGVADADDGVLALAAEPEMAMVHQEFGAVVFGCDGVGLIFGDALVNFDGFDVELKARVGAGFGADFAGDGDGGFLGEGFEGVERFFGEGAFDGDALDEAGAVAELGEDDFAGLADVVEPAGDGDGLVRVTGGFGDGDSLRHGAGFSLADVSGVGGFLGCFLGFSGCFSGFSGYFSGYEIGKCV